MMKKSRENFPLDVFRSKKSALTRGLVRAFALLATLAAAPAAQAAVVEDTNHAGSICRNYYAAQATWIQAYPNGIRNVAADPTYVICPLTRNSNTTTGALIYVEMEQFFSPQTTSCTAFSHDLNGRLLESRAAAWTGIGRHTFVLNLTRSDRWSDYSVYCKIPGNRSAQLYNVDVDEH